MTVAEAVEDGVARVRAIRSDPLRAYMLRILGQSYIQLGEPAIADSLLQEALAIHGEAASSEEASLVRMHLLSTRDALSDPNRVLVLGRRLYADHRDDPDPGIALSALKFVSRAELSLGEPGRAIEVATLARRRALEGGTPEQRIGAIGNLGEMLAVAGQREEALPYLEEAVQLSEATFGVRNDQTYSAKEALAGVLGELGETERAEALLRASIAFHAQRYKSKRVGVGYGYLLASLGQLKLRTGEFREAASLFDSAATMSAPIIGRDHEAIGEWRTLQAEALNGSGAYAEAEAAARAALATPEARGRDDARVRARRQLDVARSRGAQR